jgi:hypothetical protein
VTKDDKSLRGETITNGETCHVPSSTLGECDFVKGKGVKFKVPPSSNEMANGLVVRKKARSMEGPSYGWVRNPTKEARFK